MLLCVLQYVEVDDIEQRDMDDKVMLYLGYMT